MSLYIIEDDDGYVLTNECYFDNTMVYARLYDEPSEPEHDVEEFGGHIVTLTEEPEKVVLSKEQAEIVEEAHDSTFPASYIAGSSDDEKLIMNAYVNGYTVAKENKYNVKVPHTQDAWYFKGCDGKLQTICFSGKELRGKFTEADIERYGLQDCEKVEVEE